MGPEGAVDQEAFRETRSDRLACPWLVKQFIDSEAVIVYVLGEKLSKVPIAVDKTVDETLDALAR